MGRTFEEDGVELRAILIEQCSMVHLSQSFTQLFMLVNGDAEKAEFVFRHPTQ